VNHLDRLTSLIWWQNYRGAAETKLKAATDARDRSALYAVIANCDDVIARMAPIVAADARATLARLDAEDAAEAVVS
jgi:hypothetical protein